jgi:hypothetical protein
MRKTIGIVLAAMLASSMALAQSNTNSGAGVAGKPGSKSGPAMTKSGSGSSNQNGSNPDQSNVKGHWRNTCLGNMPTRCGLNQQER